jgi:PIN domain nuclease of toxin-antitoxin system
MRLLVDTHVLLWAAAQPERLPPTFRRRLESPESTVLFSSSSIWEIAIKSRIGRLELAVEPEEIARTAVERGFEELPITSVHAAATARLPLFHRDPFDRLLVAQAIEEPARLLTMDRALSRYSELVELVGPAD